MSAPFLEIMFYLKSTLGDYAVMYYYAGTNHSVLWRSTFSTRTIKSFRESCK